LRLAGGILLLPVGIALALFIALGDVLGEWWDAMREIARDA